MVKNVFYPDVYYSNRCGNATNCWYTHKGIAKTADEFKNVYSIKLKAERAFNDVISEASRSYRFRWEQLKAGNIERVEGCAAGTGEYAEQQMDKGLFPLTEYKGEYSEDKFDKGYKNLK